MYILRLLAGKFGPVCTEFPLTTFLVKFLTRLPSKIPAEKIVKQHLVQKNYIVNANFSFTLKNSNSLKSCVF